MGEVNSEPRIELGVTNFGPIAEAEIDLRPLTVFVGPSNTGKTYLATFIYALHLSVAQRRQQFPRTEASRADIEVVTKWLERLSITHSTDTGVAERTGLIVPEVEQIIQDRLASETRFGELLWRAVTRCFGAGEDIGSLTRARVAASDPVSVNVVVDQAQPDASLHLYSAFDDAGTNVATEFSISGIFDLSSAAEVVGLSRGFPVLWHSLSTAEEGGRENFARFAIDELAAVAIAQGFGPFGKDAYYLPADRSGVMHAHAAVVSALVSQASFGGLRPQSDLPLLSGVLSDFLQELIAMGQQNTPPGKHCAALADDLESGILNGVIDQELSDARYPTFTYSPRDMAQPLPLIQASSMVSELAPVVLYLRHLVDPGDTLIIEEPESHLHPAAQAEFAVHLARLVKCGVRVILTTHSNWIVDQISNLVKLSELGEDLTEDIHGFDAALPASSVGAWSFDGRGTDGGSSVREIKFDSDGIGYDPGYLTIADTQYDTWARAQNVLADRTR